MLVSHNVTTLVLNIGIEGGWCGKINQEKHNRAAVLLVLMFATLGQIYIVYFSCNQYSNACTM